MMIVAQNPCTTQDQRSGNESEDLRRCFSCGDVMGIYGLTNLTNTNKSYFEQRETRTGLQTVQNQCYFFHDK